MHPHVAYWEPLIPKKLPQKMTHVMYQFGPTLCRGCSFYTPFTVVKLRRYGMASREGLLNERHGGVGGVNSVSTFFLPCRCFGSLMTLLEPNISLGKFGKSWTQKCGMGGFSDLFARTRMTRMSSKQKLKEFLGFLGQI